MNLAEKIAFFEKNHYLLIPNALSPSEVVTVNAAIDRNRREYPGFWGDAARTQSAQCLLGMPDCDFLIQHPSFFPVAQHALDSDIALSEFAVMIRKGGAAENTPDSWHVDFAPNPKHRLGFTALSAIYYTTDVDRNTARYVLIPASQHITTPPKKIREEGQEREGEVEILGPAGSVVLVNAGNWHTGRVATGPRERRTVHMYYQQSTTPPVSAHSIIPRRLWDVDDPEQRRFYSHFNEITRSVAADYAREGAAV